MGMTPLEGLIMGTRCGDIDPAVHFYLLRETGRSPDELDSLLNKESGLKGICGTNDMREVLEKADEGDDRARPAIDMYCYRVQKYIGAYLAELGHADAAVAADLIVAAVGSGVPVTAALDAVAAAVGGHVGGNEAGRHNVGSDAA